MAITRPQANYDQLEDETVASHVVSDYTDALPRGEAGAAERAEREQRERRLLRKRLSIARDGCVLAPAPGRPCPHDAHRWSPPPSSY